MAHVWSLFFKMLWVLSTDNLLRFFFPLFFFFSLGQDDRPSLSILFIYTHLTNPFSGERKRKEEKWKKKREEKRKMRKNK